MKTIVALLLTVFSLPLASASAGAERPNVVVIMADDIGVGDIGFYHRQRTGQEPIVPTPHLDGLIERGMRFSDAHSPASLCAPTRYSMLTGNYPDRSGRIFGVWKPEAKAGIDPKWTTSGRLAQAGGYHTAFFGKWGLGGVFDTADHGNDRLDAGALSYGFDYAVELPDGIQNPPLAFYENREWMKLRDDSELIKLTKEQARFTGKGGRVINPNLIGDSHWDPALAGPVLARKAVQYISDRTTHQPDQPFFIYFCSQAVHIPHTPPAELDGVQIAGSTPNAFGDMIVEFDTQVGMLVNALKAAGVYDDTLFIVTSDNGGLNYDPAMKKAGHDSSNGLRAKKGSIYEGGHRVPFIATWPQVIPPGTESHDMIVAHDVVATVGVLAGQPIDRKVIKDAIDLGPLFAQTPATATHAVLIHQSKFGPRFALREGDWKLIVKAAKHNDVKGLTPIALFNLADNPAEDEADNLLDAPDASERIDAMLSRYKAYRRAGKPTVTPRP